MHRSGRKFPSFGLLRGAKMVQPNWELKYWIDIELTSDWSLLRVYEGYSRSTARSRSLRGRETMIQMGVTQEWVCCVTEAVLELLSESPASSLGCNAKVQRDGNGGGAVEPMEMVAWFSHLSARLFTTQTVVKSFYCFPSDVKHWKFSLSLSLGNFR